MIDVIFNMETADPDDVLTLCFLYGNPNVNLVGVVITPGADDQVSLVRHVLERLGSKHLPIGVRKPNHPKNCVSAFHYKWFGNITNPPTSDALGGEVIASLKKNYPNLVVLSGAPLGNVYQFLKEDGAHLNEIVVQGGFAGDNIVPDGYRLDKFVGRETCPTFNLGGDKEAALYITGAGCLKVDEQFYVSKNVCHGVCYDQKLHDKMRAYKDKRVGLSMIYNGMSIYLKHKPNGKLFHDPLAACAMIDKSVCDFVPVDLFYKKGEWGSRHNVESNICISIKVNTEDFERILFQ